MNVNSKTLIEATDGVVSSTLQQQRRMLMDIAIMNDDAILKLHYNHCSNSGGQNAKTILGQALELLKSVTTTQDALVEEEENALFDSKMTFQEYLYNNNEYSLLHEERQDQQVNEQEPSQQQNSDDQIVIAVSIPSQQHHKKTTLTTRLNLDEIPQEDMLIYDKAFLLHHSVIPMDIMSTSAIVLYNFALLIHIKAINKNSTTLYKKAMALYTRVVGLIKVKDEKLKRISSSSSLRSCSSRRLLQLVLLATLHNLAHCNVVGFMDRQVASNYQHAMADTIHEIILLLVKEEENEEDSVTTWIKKELKFLYLSLIVNEQCSSKVTAPMA